MPSRLSGSREIVHARPERRQLLQARAPGVQAANIAIMPNSPLLRLGRCACISRASRAFVPKDAIYETSPTGVHAKSAKMMQSLLLHRLPIFFFRSLLILYARRCRFLTPFAPKMASPLLRFVLAHLSILALVLAQTPASSASTLPSLNKTKHQCAAPLQ